jgi:hypothetical protein
MDLTPEEIALSAALEDDTCVQDGSVATLAGLAHDSLQSDGVHQQVSKEIMNLILIG